VQTPDLKPPTPKLVFFKEFFLNLSSVSMGGKETPELTGSVQWPVRDISKTSSSISSSTPSAQATWMQAMDEHHLQQQQRRPPPSPKAAASPSRTASSAVAGSPQRLYNSNLYRFGLYVWLCC
jgi:hypothetical protein